MRCGIIGVTLDEPTNTELESYSEPPFAIDVEAAEDLDGDTVYHGEAAGTYEKEVPEVDIEANGKFSTEEEPVDIPVTAEWTADLDVGFVAISTSKAQFIWDHVSEWNEVTIERAEVNLDAWLEAFKRRDDYRDSWQIGWSRKDEDDNPYDSGMEYHESAVLDASPVSDIVQVGFNYMWNGRTVKGTLTSSGWTAIYEGATEPQGYSKWLQEEVMPYVHQVETGQEVLGDA